MISNPMQSEPSISKLHMNLIVGPIRLTSVASIPYDATSWHAVNEDPYVHLGSGKGVTPNRPKGMTLSKALITNSSKTLPESGLYVLGAGDPIHGIPQALYVGISGVGAGETILSRLRKHRVKLTGTHVGSGFPATSNGGVHHPQAWCNYAIERYRWHAQSGLNDICDDVWFMVLGFEDSSADKATLEFVENTISHDAEIRQALIDIMWSQTGNAHAYRPSFLTTGNSRGKRPQGGVLLSVGNKNFDF